MSEESYQSEGAQRPTSNVIDEGVADENSRCDSIGNAAADHPNNVQESTKLRLDPSGCRSGLKGNHHVCLAVSQGRRPIM
jgi:hypothetical protein